MPRLKRLSLKQKKFVKKYIESGGNATEAGLEAYNVKNRKSAQAVAYQTLDKPQVQEALELALKKNGITLDSITGEVATLAFEKDVRPTADTKLKASIELLKLLNAYPERVQKHLSYSVRQNLTEKNFSELIELHKEKSKEIEDILNS